MNGHKISKSNAQISFYYKVLFERETTYVRACERGMMNKHQDNLHICKCNMWVKRVMYCTYETIPNPSALYISLDLPFITI